MGRFLRANQGLGFTFSPSSTSRRLLDTVIGTVRDQGPGLHLRFNQDVNKVWSPCIGTLPTARTISTPTTRGKPWRP